MLKSERMNVATSTLPLDLVAVKRGCSPRLLFRCPQQRPRAKRKLPCPLHQESCQRSGSSVSSIGGFTVRALQRQKARFEQMYVCVAFVVTGASSGGGRARVRAEAVERAVHQSTNHATYCTWSTCGSDAGTIFCAFTYTWRICCGTTKYKGIGLPSLQCEPQHFAASIKPTPFTLCD